MCAKAPASLCLHAAVLEAKGEMSRAKDVYNKAVCACLHTRTLNFVHAHMHAMRACIRACTHACVHACVRAYVCKHACVRMWVRAYGYGVYRLLSIRTAGSGRYRRRW